MYSLYQVMGSISSIIIIITIIVVASSRTLKKTPNAQALNLVMASPRTLNDYDHGSMIVLLMMMLVMMRMLAIMLVM